ncbi:hypothetical protein N665_0015s0035 [Sinapis alba]|nr:hypothetical protein N665_0015s0035 [Sinapis alba]
MNINHTKKFDLSLIKSVRVVCNNPYATESSSEDEVVSRDNTRQYPTKQKQSKIHVSKICVPTLIELSNSYLEIVNGNRKSSSGFKGVRRRPWGRFAAEIRDPFQKKKTAAEAYQKSKTSFEEQLGQVNQTDLIKQEVIEVGFKKTCGSSKKKDKEVEDLTKLSNDLVQSPSSMDTEASGEVVNMGTVVEKTFGFGFDDDEEEGTIDRMFEDPLMTSSISDIFADTFVKTSDFKFDFCEKDNKNAKTKSDIKLGFDPMMDDSKLGDFPVDDFDVDSWLNGNMDWIDMGCL